MSWAALAPDGFDGERRRLFRGVADPSNLELTCTYGETDAFDVSDDLREHLIKLETRLLDPDVRASADLLTPLLADDVKSLIIWRRYSKAEL